jgi:starch phosphorylase
MRGKSRERVVRMARTYLAAQLRERSFSLDTVRTADTVLDANVLTLGFARRFTEYKRPNLLLRDKERFGRLLLNERRPVQIVVAGKAHPADIWGKEMIREWIEFARQPQFRRRVIFLNDYDINLAQELVQGVDVWINTPRRPWEACGTSGMKVLVNGGLNFSVLDGWWDEAYAPDVGWVIGDGGGGTASVVDARDGESLYHILETKVVPEFYDRDATGMPRAWLSRIRRSMGKLTAAFSSTRMMENYVEDAYLPLATATRERLKGKCIKARGLNEWSRAVFAKWPSLHIGNPTIKREEAKWHVVVPIYLGEVLPSWAQIEMFADATDEHPPEVVALHRGEAIAGSSNGYVYSGLIETRRSSDDYTVRAVPYNADAILPSELPLITWQR